MHKNFRKTLVSRWKYGERLKMIPLTNTRATSRHRELFEGTKTYFSVTKGNANRFQDVYDFLELPESIMLFGGMGPGVGIVPLISSSGPQTTIIGNSLEKVVMWEYMLPLTPCMAYFSNSYDHSDGLSSKHVREEHFRLWNSTQNIASLPGPKLLLSEEPRLVPQGLHISSGNSEHEPLFKFHTESLPSDRIVPLRSLGKAMVAAVCLVLEEKGLISLDSPVCETLACFDTPGKRKITLKMLLSNTSGITGSEDSRALSDPGISLLDAAKIVADENLECEPGTQFIYSNMGWQVVGAVIEATTRSTFADSFHKYLAEPLGISQVRFYNWNSSKKNPSNPNPGFGACGPTECIICFLQMLARNGQAPNGKQVLSVQSVQKMMCHQVVAKDFSASSLGLEINQKLLELPEILSDCLPRDMLKSVESYFSDASMSYGLGLFYSINTTTGREIATFLGSTGCVGMITRDKSQTEYISNWAVSISISKLSYYQIFPLPWILEKLNMEAKRNKYF